MIQYKKIFSKNIEREFNMKNSINLLAALFIINHSAMQNSNFNSPQTEQEKKSDVQTLQAGDRMHDESSDTASQISTVAEGKFILSYSPARQTTSIQGSRINVGDILPITSYNTLISLPSDMQQQLLSYWNSARMFLQNNDEMLRIMTQSIDEQKRLLDNQNESKLLEQADMRAISTDNTELDSDSLTKLKGRLKAVFLSIINDYSLSVRASNKLESCSTYKELLEALITIKYYEYNPKQNDAHPTRQWAGSSQRYSYDRAPKYKSLSEVPTVEFITQLTKLSKTAGPIGMMFRDILETMNTTGFKKFDTLTFSSIH